MTFTDKVIDDLNSYDDKNDFLDEIKVYDTTFERNSFSYEITPGRFQCFCIDIDDDDIFCGSSITSVYISDKDAYTIALNILKNLKKKSKI